MYASSYPDVPVFVFFLSEFDAFTYFEVIAPKMATYFLF